ncbi:MAG: hypothetical protein ABI896_02885 [Actinomycetota bacterium]
MVRLWLAGKIATPQLLCDEFIYADIAKNVASEGRFALRQQPTHFSLAYPLLIAPAWFAHSMTTGYELAKALNVAAMTLAAVPVYLWTRRLTRPWLAVTTTGLVLCLPAYNYTDLLLSENAFFPTFLLAVFAISLSLETVTVGRQLFALAAIALACTARVQGLVLIPILVSAIGLKLILDRRSPADGARPGLLSELRRHAPSFAAVAVLASGYVLLQLARGQSFSAGFGGYGAAVDLNYSFFESLRRALFHVEAITLAVGVLPVGALIVLLGVAVSRRVPTRPAERAFLAVTAAAIFWVAIEAGLYTSRYAGGISDRYVFYVGPLLLISLVVWLDRGLPRPPVAVVIACVVPAALVIFLPLASFIPTSPLYASFGLFPFFRAAERISGGAERVELLVSIAAVPAALALVLVPRRIAGIAFPAALAVFFVLSSTSVFRAIEGQAGVVASQPGAGPAFSWVERGIGRDREASYIYTVAPEGPTASSFSLLGTAFWNRNVAWVSNTGTSELCPLPEKQGTIDYATGRILPTDGSRTFAARYVVADRTLNLAGKVVAQSGPLVTYRVDSPLHLASVMEGVSSDGWMGSTLSYTRYGAAEPSDRVEISLSRLAWAGPDVPGKVRISIGTISRGPNGPTIGRVTGSRSWVIHSRSSRAFNLPVPGPRFRVEVTIKPTFSPSDYGIPDTRRLGAQVSFRYVKAGA